MIITITKISLNEVGKIHSNIFISFLLLVVLNLKRTILGRRKFCKSLGIILLVWVNIWGMSLTGGEGGGGSLPGSAPGSQPGSPRNRVKLLCSHGGKILPRPADGQLKYVGGETRVISVPRDITFPELMKKLTYLIDGEMLLKYQLMPEDLDALVSVKSDEDLRHMFEEYDRHETSGYPRLRTFLFPANPIVIENQLGSMDRHTLEQRYINSINGIVHPSFKPPPICVSHASFSISSACSSPRSPTPESCATEGSNHEIMMSNSYHSGRSSLHRIQSSPSMYNLNSQQSHSTSTQIHQHHYHYYQPFRHLQTPQHHHAAYLQQKPPLDPHPHRSHGPEQLLKVRSVGRAESSRYQVDHVPNYQSSPTRPSRGSLCCSKHLHYDDYGIPVTGRLERAESVPGSPSLPQSPTSRLWI